MKRCAVVLLAMLSLPPLLASAQDDLGTGFKLGGTGQAQPAAAQHPKTVTKTSLRLLSDLLGFQADASSTNLSNIAAGGGYNEDSYERMLGDYDKASAFYKKAALDPALTSAVVSDVLGATWSAKDDMDLTRNYAKAQGQLQASANTLGALQTAQNAVIIQQNQKIIELLTKLAAK